MKKGQKAPRKTANCTKCGLKKRADKLAAHLRVCRGVQRLTTSSKYKVTCGCGKVLFRQNLKKHQCPQKSQQGPQNLIFEVSEDQNIEASYERSPELLIVPNKPYQLPPPQVEREESPEPEYQEILVEKTLLKPDGSEELKKIRTWINPSNPLDRQMLLEDPLRGRYEYRDGQLLWIPCQRWLKVDEDDRPVPQKIHQRIECQPTNSLQIEIDRILAQPNKNMQKFDSKVPLDFLLTGELLSHLLPHHRNKIFYRSFTYLIRRKRRIGDFVPFCPELTQIDDTLANMVDMGYIKVFEIPHSEDQINSENEDEYIVCKESEPEQADFVECPKKKCKVCKELVKFNKDNRNEEPKVHGEMQVQEVKKKIKKFQCRFCPSHKFIMRGPRFSFIEDHPGVQVVKRGMKSFGFWE